MDAVGSGLKFRMELAGQEEGVVLQFHNFYQVQVLVDA